MSCFPSPALERGVAMISLDSEQIWGFVDMLDDAQFSSRYPDAPGAYDRMLQMLCSAQVSATWLLVGGLTLTGTSGSLDPRFSGLPRPWVERIPQGDEVSRPLWYRRSFIQRLKSASTPQEIGLHGGLTHMIWNHPGVTRDAVEWELFHGLKALRDVGIHPASFTYTRNQIAFVDMLPAHGLRCYRGRPPLRSERWGRSLTGAALRVMEELGRFTPPPVWPMLELGGRLWNIPASAFIYPLARYRSLVIPLRTRFDRFKRGLDAAIRARGIFHFGLHPANLAEHPGGFALFENMLEELNRRRAAGDIEVLTMAQVPERMTRAAEPPREPTLEHQEAVTATH